MRIAELSRRTGVPVPTIKYYLRERILPPGREATGVAPRYGPAHVRRLNLVRALVDVGGLPMATVRDLVADLDSRRSTPPRDVTGRATARDHRDHRETGLWREASAEADALFHRRGWRIRENHPARQQLVGLVVQLRQLGQANLLGLLDEYAAAAEHLAAAEMRTVPAESDASSVLEEAVLNMVLGDVISSTLRRLAQEHVSVGRFGAESARAAREPASETG
ncbi:MULTISPECIES: MerR family transcriptional regulator [Actinoalloteichus]|uniref:DNA-binding transcriptional regulator, MerR family n=1 Tax=Actinoalloteichus caeruleus DSM 43889 TaxID=1120930 RepID=A0ABT1JSL4_ACTCY|nr:MerR family transcriptional regulator [Actinoalloteichus caeruleus]MCP2334616.1 DNA-binding transcriptional regulator, MerR family [Actinoalloteichus caeruleus DSM 43889]